MEERFSTITITDGLYIRGPWPEALKEAVTTDLTIENPAYYEAKKYGRSTRQLEPVLKLYRFNQTQTTMRVPRGYRERLLFYFNKYELPYFIEDHRILQPVTLPIFKGDLKDYQRPAVMEAYRKKEGVIESPCGSGKTVMGLYLLALCGQKALWLTHTKDLLYQTMSAIEHFLDIPRERIGVIGEGKRELGEVVTVGLVQSLIRDTPSNLRESFGTVIVDEAHRVPSKTFKEVVENTASMYRFGLTATPKRKDGLESILFYVMGEIIYRITQEDLAEEGEIIIPQIIRLSTPFQAARTTTYHSLIERMITDTQREQYLLEVILHTFKRGDKALVLSSRVKHCRRLETLLHTNSTLRTAVLTGEMKKSQRERTIERAKRREIDILIATRVADEGLDLPHLTKLYLVTPMKSQAKLKQQLGRVMRPFEDKREAHVFDFVDSNIPLFQRQYNLRKMVYHQLGCVVEGLTSL